MKNRKINSEIGQLCILQLDTGWTWSTRHMWLCQGGWSNSWFNLKCLTLAKSHIGQRVGVETLNTNSSNHVIDAHIRSMRVVYHHDTDCSHIAVVFRAYITLAQVNFISANPLFLDGLNFLLYTSSDLMVPATRRSTLGDRAFAVARPRAWNNLPDAIRHSPSLETFKRSFKSHLFLQCFLLTLSFLVFVDIVTLYSALKWLCVLRHSTYWLFYTILHDVIITLRTSCGAVYCNRSCLFVCGFVAVFLDLLPR